MDINKLIPSIREDISKNRLDLAITKLKGLFNKTTMLYDVVMQEARHNDIKKQIRYGIIDFDKSNIEKNKIRKSLLDIIEEINYAQKYNNNVRNELNSLNLKELNNLSIPEEPNGIFRIIKLNLLYLIVIFLLVITSTFLITRNTFSYKNSQDNTQKVEGSKNDIIGVPGNNNKVLQGNNNRIGDDINMSYFIQGDEMIFFASNENGDTLNKRINKVSYVQNYIKTNFKNEVKTYELNNIEFKSDSSVDRIKFFDGENNVYKYIGVIGSIHDINGIATRKGNKIILNGNYGRGELTLSKEAEYLVGYITDDENEKVSFNGVIE